MKRVFSFLLTLSLVMGLVACVRKTEDAIVASQPEQTQPIPVTVPTETEAVTEETTEPPALASTEPAPASTEPAPEADPLPLWQGKAQGKTTTFYYDLDGDGTKERYLFGCDFQNSPHSYEAEMHFCGYFPGDTIAEEVYPCVWRVNKDGSKEVAEEFSGLLTDTKATFWRVGSSRTPDPQLLSGVNGEGSVKFVLCPEDDNQWLYQVTAKIGNKKLTAQIHFRFIPHDVFPDETAFTLDATPLQQWKGSSNGTTTAFRYDLDGDGQTEKYIFGVDYFASPPFEEVLRERNSAFIGEILIRELFPCVWRVNEDGTKSVEPAFAELLTDSQSQLWRIGRFQTPDPTLYRVDYKWAGAMRAEFWPQDESKWLYRVTATLDGRELTAQACFCFIPQEP